MDILPEYIDETIEKDSQRRLDATEREELLLRFNLPNDATNRDISEAIEKDRQRRLDATEREDLLHTFNLPSDATDSDISDAIDGVRERANEDVDGFLSN